jgi:hypothetical protein
VLKKAGIVVATAAAGLLAASPLAFADDKDDHDRDDDHKKVKVEDVNHVEDANKGRVIAVNVCNNDVGLDVLEEVWGVLPLWGEVSKSEDRNCENNVDADHSIEQ